MEREELEMASVPGANSLDNVLNRVMVEDAIERLPEELREVVILYYFQGLKLIEIAGVLKIGLPLAKYRLGQARKQ